MEALNPTVLTRSHLQEKLQWATQYGVNIVKVIGSNATDEKVKAARTTDTDAGETLERAVSVRSRFYNKKATSQ